MSIEPTEEQRSDAAAFYHNSIQSLPLDVCDWVETGAGCVNVDADVVSLARLLAEREAKLQARIDDLTEELAATDTTEMRLRSEVDTLGARIAELEAQLHRHRSNRMSNIIKPSECSYPECGPACRKDCPPAASTKALREALKLARSWIFSGMPDAVSESEAEEIIDDAIATTAHYDDAKADAPAVDMQAWANGSCPEPGCSLANPHEQGAACVKPTAEGEATNE